jgi:hypothetical protein
MRFGIAFAITLAIGLLDYQQASAIGCRGCEDVSQPLGDPTRSRNSKDYCVELGNNTDEISFYDLSTVMLVGLKSIIIF